MNATLGAGSELIIDVAAGVDWTAAIAVVYGIQQVCRRPSVLHAPAHRSLLSEVLHSAAVTDTATENTLASAGGRALGEGRLLKFRCQPPPGAFCHPLEARRMQTLRAGPDRSANCACALCESKHVSALVRVLCAERCDGRCGQRHGHSGHRQSGNSRPSIFFPHAVDALKETRHDAYVSGCCLVHAQATHLTGNAQQFARLCQRIQVRPRKACMKREGGTLLALPLSNAQSAAHDVPPM